ncbi:dihydroorotate oxidase [Blattabacterium cuenoti]|uniref:dihydroorotate oxidase n=1 Tax=Blattabacterium cuenoti TaxID=1653831 RepID=UPI00163CC29E|nr:dihydroorotate oxidase [Blattabacterium cuenoti]
MIMKKKIDISANINGISLASCIMNASGVLCTTKEELNKLIISSSGAVVTKSCTLKPRKGNLEPRYFEWNMGSINSMGLPNLGIDFYLDFFEKKNHQKPFFLSISGLSIEENYLLLHKANLSSHISAVELNFSCPNIIGKDQVLGYDFNNISIFLENIFKFYKKPLGIKLPPYFENIHIQKMAFILNKYPISFVTCINSLPNGLFIDINKETVVIQPKMGFGGIGGKTIKPFALANIRQFYTYLRKGISIIGCGGICSGEDIFEHILCGASAVQIGTQFIKEGISIFDRLRKELVDILQKKKYTSINRVIGKLNVF